MLPDKEELFNYLKEAYFQLSKLLEKSKRNFCGDCHFCCTYAYHHGVCSVEFDYIKEYLKHKGKEDYGDKFRYYIEKKRDSNGELIYKECPLYDCNIKGCSIYPVRPYSCRIYGPYSKVPHPPLCSFFNFVIIYPEKNFYDIVPYAREVFKIKCLYEIITAENKEEKAEKLYLLGSHLYYKQLDDEAKIYLEMAVNENPYHSQAYYQLAIFYYNKNNITEAVKYIKEALKHEPENIKMRTHSGLYLMLMGKYQEAKEDFALVLEKEPANKMALLGMEQLNSMG